MPDCPKSSDVSRAISHALRHQPWHYQLELDDEGWVDLGALLCALREQGPAWSTLTENDIVQVVECSDKKRHQIVGKRIRALYGHSVPKLLKKQPRNPPQFLFHGTSKDNAQKILAEGLVPMNRQYVHLSSNKETALAVGFRKDAEPALIQVESHRAFSSGVNFYVGNDEVWLADVVPSSFLKIIEDSAFFRIQQKNTRAKYKRQNASI